VAPVLRRSLLLLAFVLATAAVLLFVSGGFITTIAGIGVSARSPGPAMLAAGVALAAWAMAAWRARALASDAACLAASLCAYAPAIVPAIAGMAAAVAVFFSTFSAAGADASGYLSHAAMLWNGELSRVESVAAIARWGEVAAALAPLGWQTAQAGVQVPTYPVGLPLLMASLHGVGGALAACLVVPVAFGVAVWASGRLAHRVGGPLAAVLAAVWLASSPIALAAAIQPMSDMPVTAAWLMCWLLLVTVVISPAQCRPVRGMRSWSEAGGRRRGRTIEPGGSQENVTPAAGGSTTRSPDPTMAADMRVVLAGMTAALAVLIRPNLAPLALVPVLYLLVGSTASPLARRLRWGGMFALPVAIAGAGVGYLQWRWFGSPWRSGYGTAAEIYAVANVWPNAALYARWLLDTHGPWLFVAPAAVFLPGVRALRWLLLFAGLVTAAYLVYAVFEVWTYLRFVLPALAIGAIAVACLMSAMLNRLPRPVLAPALWLAVVALFGSHVASARDHDVFRLKDHHARALLAGRYLEPLVRPQGLIISGEQSGALRYYTGQPILRWDLTAAEVLPEAIEQLTRAGIDVWVALDEWEEEPFRQKFSGVTDAGLDWPPVVDAGTAIRTRAWRLRDRQRFIRGEPTAGDRLR
jgi:hypothetical protein